MREIAECPPLEDLSEFLNWRIEYAPWLGSSLKNYLASANPQLDGAPLNLLEIEPGRVLKLVSHPDMENLKSSIEKGDATNACAQLISLLALKYRGISSAPHALIVNEMQSSLSVLLKNMSDSKKMANSKIFSDQMEPQLIELYERYLSLRSMDDESMTISSGEISASLNVGLMRFVVKFIESIPFRLAVEILFSFVLDPLVQLTSNHDFKTQVTPHKIHLDSLLFV